MPPKSMLSSLSNPSSLLPLHTFFFKIFDLKLGSEIITWFAILNKVAGLYGLLAVFTGGTLIQLSMYLYSIATLLVSAWGAKQIGEENPIKTLTYAHYYFIDHIISTLYTVYFGIIWYIYTPHDGRRIAHSAAQKAILEGSAEGGLQGSGLPSDDAERVRLALQIWNDEKGFSTTVLVLGWLIKLYFIAILYSYAIHLRRGTFRNILAQHQASKVAALRRPGAASSGPSGGSNSSNGYAYSHLRTSSLASNGTTSAAGGGGQGADVLWDDAENDVGLNGGESQMLYGHRDERS